MNNLIRLSLLSLSFILLIATNLSSQNIIVTQPNGGLYIAGEPMLIKWESDVVIGDVAIELTTPDFEFKQLITEKTVNDGEYIWTITDGLIGSFRIGVYESETGNFKGYSEIFQIALCNDIEVEIIGETSYCEGETIMLMANSPMAEAIQWETPVGPVSGPNIIFPGVDESYSGEYIVYVTDGMGCANSASVEVIVFPLPSAKIEEDATVCQGDPEPPITFTGAGGIPPYTFRFSINSEPSILIETTSETATIFHPTDVVGEFIYKLTGVRDGNGCETILEDDITITVEEPATAEAGPNQEVCSDDPTIQLEGVIGGSASTGTWSGGSGTYSPNNTTLNAMYTPSAAEITAGSITLTLTTNNPPGSCPAVSDEVEIIISPEATANAGPGQSVCASNPSVTLAGMVGGSATSGSWSGGSGTYSPNNTSLTATYTPSTAEINAGAVTLALTTNNPPGICQAESDFVVIVINPIPDLEISGSVSFCEGSSSIITAVEAGTTNTPSDWMILWSTGAVSNSITIDDDIQYSVTVTDANGCSASASIIGEISENLDVSISFQDGNANLCEGETATICADPGDYTYLWNNMAVTQCLDDVGPGTYSVTVTDVGSSCTGTAEVVINEIESPTATISGNATVCQNSDEPEIVFQASGGEPEYTFTYRINGGTEQTITTTGSNIASVFQPTNVIDVFNYELIHVVDGKGCETDLLESIVIEVIAGPTVEAGSYNPVCSNNPEIQLAGSTSGTSIAATWSGGSGSFIPDNMTLDAIYIPSSGELVTGSVTLVLTVEGTPECGMVSDEVTITISNGVQVVDINNTQSSICMNSSTMPLQGVVTLTNGATGQGIWDDGGIGGMFSGGTGNENAIYTPPNNFIGLITLTLTANDPDGVGGSNPCQGGQQAVKTLQITENPSLEIIGSPNYCTGSNSTVTAVEEGTTNTPADWMILWSTGANTASIMIDQEITYSVTITDANGCSAEASIIGVESGGLDITITEENGNTDLCGDETATICAPEGNYTYSWGGGEVTQCLTDVGVGTYMVTVTDIVSSCTGTDMIEITSSPEPEALFTSTSLNYCVGSPSPEISIQFTGTAPFTFTYTVDGVPSTVTNHPTNIYVIPFGADGVYVVTFLEDNVCISTNDPVSNTLTVVENPLPDLMITPENPSFCAGSSVLVTTSEMFVEYDWRNNVGAQISDVQNVLIDIEGDYSLIVTDENGCTATGTFIVTEESSINVTIVGDNILCGMSTSILEAFPNGSSVIWSNGSTDNPLTISEPGDYTVTVTDVSGCSGVNSINVESFDAPSADPVQVIYEYCEGENLDPVEFTLIGMPPFSNVKYNYNDDIFDATVIGNMVFIDNPMPGTYSIVSIEDSVCETDADYQSVSVVVEVFSLPDYVVLSSEGTLICEGTTTTLSTDFDDPENYSYVWIFNGEEISTSPTVDISTPGIYTVITTNLITGCASTKNITIMNSATGASISSDQTNNQICAGEIVTLFVNGAATVEWESPIPPSNQGDLTVIVTPNESTVYTVTATNSVGCSETLNIEIEVISIGAPAIQIDPSQEFYCEGTDLLLSMENGFDTYLWSNGTENSTNNFQINSAVNEYSVTVTSGGCEASSSLSIDIRERPSANITTDNFSVQAELPIDFTAIDIEFDPACTGIAEFNWSFWDENDNVVISESEDDPDLTVTFETADTIIDRIQLVVVDECGCESAPDEIFYEVRENGSCGAELTFPQSFCAGSEICFEANAIPASSAGSQEVVGYWVINGESIIDEGDYGNFEVIGIDQVNFANYNEKITVVFDEVQTFTINYFVDFDVCTQLSPLRTFEIAPSPEFNSIEVKDVACFNEDILVTFDYDNPVDWTLCYEENGSKKDKQFLPSSSNTILFENITGDLVLNFISLLDNDTQCENKSIESRTIEVLDQSSFEIIDTMCLPDLSYSVTYSVTGGSGEFNLINSSSQGNLNGNVYTSGIIDDVGEDIAIISDEECSEQENLTITTDIECDCLDFPVQYNPILYSACSSAEIKPDISNASFLSHPNAVQYYDVFRIENGQIVETIIEDEIFENENDLSFSYFDNSGNPLFTDGQIYNVKVFVSTRNPVTGEINSDYRCINSSSNFTIRFFEDPTPEITGASQVCLNLQDVFVSIDESSNSNIYNWNFTPPGNVVIEEINPFSYLLEFTDQGISIDVEEIRNPTNNLECKGEDSKTITISDEEAPEKAEIILFPAGFFVCDLPATDYCFYWYSIDKSSLERTFEHQGREWIGGEAVDTNNFVYLCEVRNKNSSGECDDSSSCASLNFYNSTGIYSGIIWEEGDLIIYPNPASEILFLESILDFEGKLEVKVIDILGQAQNVPILSHSNSNSVRSIDMWKLDVSYLTKGVYILQIRIQGTDKFIAKKFFIQ